MSAVVSDFLVCLLLLLRTCIDASHASGLDTLVPFSPTDSVVCDTGVFYVLHGVVV